MSDTDLVPLQVYVTRLQRKKLKTIAANLEMPVAEMLRKWIDVRLIDYLGDDYRREMNGWPVEHQQSVEERDDAPSPVERVSP